MLCWLPESKVVGCSLVKLALQLERLLRSHQWMLGWSWKDLECCVPSLLGRMWAVYLSRSRYEQGGNLRRRHHLLALVEESRMVVVHLSCLQYQEAYLRRLCHFPSVEIQRMTCHPRKGCLLTFRCHLHYFGSIPKYWSWHNSDLQRIARK